MARVFDSASEQYLTITIVAAAFHPITMACWFKTTDMDNNQALICIVDNSGGGEFFRLLLRGAEAGDPVTAQARGGPGGDPVDTSSGYSSGVWHHACAVFVNSTERHVYIDGGSKVSDNDNSGNPGSLDRTAIGFLDRADVSTGFMNGSIAEVGIWGSALTDSQVGILADGYSPLSLLPFDLRVYLPLIRDDDNSWGRYRMEFNAINGPTIAKHPRVFYPRK